MTVRFLTPIQTQVKKSFSILVVLGLFLGACSNPNQTETPTEEGAETATETTTEGEPYTVGMVLVGPKEDGGWNQAHYEGMEYVLEKLDNINFEYVDKVNPADRPNVKGAQVADDLIAKGAKFIIFNSDDLKDDALETAKKHPDVTVIHASGDAVWEEGKNYTEQPNLGNIMGKMEYGKAIAGCAAALASETGNIGYLGALINDETRRLVNSAYLGAKYCWENYRNKNADDLTFKVTWIGFWFNIPGVTLDPTKVADDFYNGGFDVLISGIDTPEAAVQGKKAAEAGKQIKFVHYDLPTGCEFAPDICLGVPYFNWGPLYQEAIADAREGNFTSEFIWAEPNWSDLNNPETSAIGFNPGKALGDTQQSLDKYIAGLGDGSIKLFAGPLKFQDGSEFLAEGEEATDVQIWYMPQLLEGIDGASE